MIIFWLEQKHTRKNIHHFIVLDVVVTSNSGFSVVNLNKLVNSRVVVLCPVQCPFMEAVFLSMRSEIPNFVRHCQRMFQRSRLLEWDVQIKLIHQETPFGICGVLHAKLLVIPTIIPLNFTVCVAKNRCVGIWRTHAKAATSAETIREPKQQLN